MIDIIGTIRRLVAAVGTDIATIASVLGELDSTASTGAATDTDVAMAYLKQLITGLALDGTTPFSYDFSKGSVSGWFEGMHNVPCVLFIIPEAVASITVHNAAILVELEKLSHVLTITQTDALIYPDFESVTVVVLGSPLAGTAWTTSNLAHVKSIFGLPVLCVDAIAAAYLAMGTDGGNAASKTVLNAIANIKASVIGIGHEGTTGLAVGANTVADAGVTFSTLDMSDADITEIWYAYESVNANTDVILGEIRKQMPDSTPGIDADGAEVPGSLGFYGCAYSMNGLNTLGKAVFHLLVEQLIHVSKAGLQVSLSGNVGNVVSTIGVKSTPAATGAVSNAKMMMAYVKQLVTQLLITDTAVDAIPTTPTLQATWTDARAGYLDELDFDLQAALNTIASYIDTEVAAITPAGPTLTQMNTAHDLLATEAKQDIIDTNVDQIEALVATTVAGKPQIKVDSTDWNSLAANTYALVTAVDQDVIIESITLYTTRDLSGDAGFTGVSYQTDATTPEVLISQANGVKANLTAEGQIYSGGLAVLLKTGTYIEFTVYDGAVAALESLVDVVITFKAVVSGGYIA